MIWQVFWLDTQFNGLPIYLKVALKIEPFPKLSAAGGAGVSYSYGDSVRF
jgi:hypothetical protein